MSAYADKAVMTMCRCDFCESDKDKVCIRAVTGKAVCVDCVDSMNMMMPTELGGYPMGAVACDSCRNYESFRAVTKYGASLHFECKEVPKAVDEDTPPEVVRYAVVGSNQTWAPGSHPDRFLCGACDKRISPDRVYRNKYVAEILPKRKSTKKKKKTVIDTDNQPEPDAAS